MSARLEAIADEILRIEGGFVNHPADPGGATNHGISLRYARSKGLQFDLDRDGDVDEHDIRLVTPEIARGAFFEDFFYGPKIHTLPEPLHAQMFDYAVNSGPGQAIKSLQHALNRLGYRLATDGRIGLMTQQATLSAVTRFGVAAVNNALVEERQAFLRDLVRRKPEKRVFHVGWQKRAASFWL